MESIQKLIAKHQELLVDNPYAYFELAYVRQVMWGASICDRPPNAATGKPEAGRQIIAEGQGETPDAACKAALDSLPVRAALNMAAASRSVVMPQRVAASVRVDLQAEAEIATALERRSSRIKTLLVELITEHTGIEAGALVDGAKLSEYGIDSLDAIEVLMALEDALALRENEGINDIAWEPMTLAEVVAEIMRQLDAADYDYARLK